MPLDLPPDRKAGDVIPSADIDMLSAAAQQLDLRTQHGATFGSRLVTLGDSLTRGDADTAPIGGATIVAAQRSWPLFVSVLSDQHVTLVANAGVTANTTAMMLERFDRDVARYRPNVVTIQAGTNEVLTGVSFALYRQQFAELVARVRAIGAQPVIASILPNTVQRQRAATFVKWQRAYAASEGIPFLDFWTLLVDPATGTLAAWTEPDGEGTHPGTPGMLAMATYALPLLTALRPPSGPPIITDNVDTDAILGNPLMLGAPANGLAPSWSLNANPAGAAYSVGTDKDFCLGNYQEIKRTGTTGDLIWHQGTGLAGNTKVQPGDRIITTGRIASLPNAGKKSGRDILRLIFGAGQPRDIYSTDVVIEAGRFYHEDVIPEGANQIDLSYIGGPGDGIFRIGQVSVINATRGGLDIGFAY